MKIVMLVLPAVAVILFVAFKMPPNIKDWFFALPIWATSSAFAYFIAKHMGGVLGGYAGVLCDFVLMPAFSMIKKWHLHCRKKEGIAPKTLNFKWAKA